MTVQRCEREEKGDTKKCNRIFILFYLREEEEEEGSLEELVRSRWAVVGLEGLGQSRTGRD